MLRSGEQVVVRLCLRPSPARPLLERDNPTLSQRETG